MIASTGPPCRVVAEAKPEQFKGISGGAFAEVHRVADTDIALKLPHEPGEAHTVERHIYERLGTRNPFILKCYGESDSVLGKGLVLEYVHAGTVMRNLKLERFPKTRKYWPIQAIEAIQYIHSKGVVHCDISVHNFLVRNDGSIVLADFCGSILDGSKPAVAPSVRYSRPLSLAERLLDPTEKDDIFALGTVLYEISVGHRLYTGKSDAEISELFQKRDFPNTSGIPENLRTVIEKCWKDQYSRADEIRSDLDPQTRGSFLTRRSLTEYIGLSVAIVLVLVAMRMKSTGFSKSANN